MRSCRDLQSQELHTMSIGDELQKLHDLRQSGAIDDEEFARAKARLLGAPAPGSWGAASLLSSDPSPEAVEHRTRQWGMLLHFSVLAGYIVPLAGLVVPIVIWQLKKDELRGVDIHGKNALNWIISHLIYGAVYFLLCFVMVGIPLFFVLGVLAVVFPIIAGIKANHGEFWRYPLSIRFV
jgi:hypothetical protein